MMIIIDEEQLSDETLAMIGNDYCMKIDYDNHNVDVYEKFVEEVVERFRFDIDEFKNRLVKSITENLKIEIKMD